MTDRPEDPSYHEYLLTTQHMSRCSRCRREGWRRRGGHPVLNGTQKDSRHPEQLGTGPSTMNPNVEHFLATGDPDVMS